jgi:hypothetical protein
MSEFSQKVKAGEGFAGSFLCARAYRNHTEDPSPPFTYSKCLAGISDRNSKTVHLEMRN